MDADNQDPSLTWDVVSYLKSITSLPIWLKGIVTPEDAALAVEHGADAVFVSNHGGRQLDHAPPTLDVLQSICKVVNGRIPVVSFPSQLNQDFRGRTLTDSTLMAASGGDRTSSRPSVLGQIWCGLAARRCGPLPMMVRQG